jgi:type IV pilus assembly protein PilY1
MGLLAANHGQLHAFKAGIYHSGNDTRTSSQTETGWFTANPTSGNGWGSVGLGDELWSFVPYDNLPHLAWLACNGTEEDPSVCGDADYTHVYYADHRPKVSDVRIFDYTDPGGDTTKDFSGISGQPGTAVHTRGWGTIMIMPLRFGGGAIDVDLNGDGDTLDTGEQSFRSAYYAFDITDPEQKPKLLWRFTDSTLGFTTSYPAIARVQDSWFMVVGSGPKNAPGSDNSSYDKRDYTSYNTTQNGRVFVVNLTTGALERTFDTGVSNSIMGDPTVVDVESDFTSDTIYIGSAVSVTGGRVYRINTKGDIDPNNWLRTTLINPLGPVLVGPSVSKDVDGNLWVFFGTGRLRATADLSNSDQQHFYGIKDAYWSDATSASGPYLRTDLLNTSAVKVTTDTGSDLQVTDSVGSACSGSTNGVDCNFSKLLENARGKSGWFIDFDPTSPPNPSERVLSRSSVLGGLVLFTTYKPTSDICSVLGDSNLYALYYETGTAYNKSVIGTYTDGGTEYVKSSTDLGKGMPTSVGVAIGETVSGFIQKSTGEIVRVEAAPGLGVRSGAAGWREKTGAGGGVEIETIYKHIVK